MAILPAEQDAKYSEEHINIITVTLLILYRGLGIGVTLNQI
jgi:hypothetical protein